MTKDFTIEQILGYAEGYKHKYGDIGDYVSYTNGEEGEVIYNPIYNKEGRALANEMVEHHYMVEKGFKNLPQTLAMQQAGEFYRENEYMLSKYILIKLRENNYREIKNGKEE